MTGARPARGGTPRISPRLERLPLLAPGMLSLLAGLWAGLSRLGWLDPTVGPAPGAHGPLMVSGFLGTLICVERAVALERPWAWGVPAVAGAGALATLAGAPWPVAPVAILLAGLGLVAIFLALLRREPVFHLAVMVGGATAWVAGTGAWLRGAAFSAVAWWWVGFLVLTIVGERIELNRVRGLSARNRGVFAVLVLLLAAALGLAHADPALGIRVLGAVLLALAGWLVVYDVARRTLAAGGLTRYIAFCLLSGYAWLGIGGALALGLGAASAGPVYDAQLHAVLVGFVLSMVLGHAPVIFPAVLRVPMAFGPSFYGPLILLHASLALRIGGDLGGWQGARRWGAMLSALALVAFVGNVVRATWVGARAPRPASAEGAHHHREGQQARPHQGPPRRPHPARGPAQHGDEPGGHGEGGDR